MLLELPKKYGLDIYAFEDYSGRAGSSNRGGIFLEVSGLYAELSIPVIIERANSENPYIRNTYRRLTQLLFDSESNRMSVANYKLIMGINQCLQIDCCDQKCVLYKLTCTGSC